MTQTTAAIPDRSHSTTGGDSMTPRFRQWAPLPLRILLGIGCVHHGWHNVIMPDERQAFGWMLGQIGISHPGTMLCIISLISFTGGLALIAGAFVRPLCIALAGNVPAILILIHLPSGFDFVKLTAVTAQGPQYGLPGYEVSLLYLAGLLSLHLSGAGPLSLDRVRARRRHGSPPASSPAPQEGEGHQEPEFAGDGFEPPASVLIAATPSNVQTRDVDAARQPRSSPAAGDESHRVLS